MKLGKLVAVIMFSCSCGSARINDITTSFEQPPSFPALSSRYPNRDYSYQRSFADIQLKTYGHLPALSCQGETTACFSALEKAVKELRSWEIVSVSIEEKRIEAIATTKLLRFKDDVSLELRLDGDLREIHMRSKSRLGKGDLGKNVARIREFFSDAAKRFPNTFHYPAI